MGIKENIAEIEERIEKACARSGRKRQEIKLLGAGKLYEREKIDEAWRAGIRLFGESRVQEALAKFRDCRRETSAPPVPGGGDPLSGAELHLIGSLQRNKAKAAAALFDCIQSLDRDELTAELGKYAPLREHPLKVFLELNAGEDSKSGYRTLDALFRGAENVLETPGLEAAGIMIMAPLSDGEADARRAFRLAAKAREELERRFPGVPDRGSWRELSMGMSGDFEIAIEEGSTLIRIGTAIFGARK
jgi:pyridoxal phosphate enzyme (YggS family)